MINDCDTSLESFDIITIDSVLGSKGSGSI